MEPKAFTSGSWQLVLVAAEPQNCGTQDCSYTELVMFSNTMVSSGISLSPPQDVQVPMTCSVSEEKLWCEHC